MNPSLIEQGTFSAGMHSSWQQATVCVTKTTKGTKGTIPLHGISATWQSSTKCHIYIYIFLSLLTISDLIVGVNCLLNMYSCSSLAAFFIAYALTFNHEYH